MSSKTSKFHALSPNYRFTAQTYLKSHQKITYPVCKWIRTVFSLINMNLSGKNRCKNHIFFNVVNLLDKWLSTDKKKYTKRKLICKKVILMHLYPHSRTIRNFPSPSGISPPYPNIELENIFT